MLDSGESSLEVKDVDSSPFVLFTDYGYTGPYVGLLHAALRKDLSQRPIIDLQHDLPPFRPRGAGLLLAAQLPWLPSASIVIAVVDPGVGTSRQGLVVSYQGHYLVGPDNGLLAPFLRVANSIQVIDWKPLEAPATFHGRDWFAPVATVIARGESFDSHPVEPSDCIGFDFPRDLGEVIYVDGFGNLITGVSGESANPGVEIRAGGYVLRSARTFADVSPGTPFWYVNSVGLVELAVNQGSAAALLGFKVGDGVHFG